mgnify:CR=1 FL=1
MLPCAARGSRWPRLSQTVAADPRLHGLPSHSARVCCCSPPPRHGGRRVARWTWPLSLPPPAARLLGLLGSPLSLLGAWRPRPESPLESTRPETMNMRSCELAGMPWGRLPAPHRRPGSPSSFPALHAPRHSLCSDTACPRPSSAPRVESSRRKCYSKMYIHTNRCWLITGIEGRGAERGPRSVCQLSGGRVRGGTGGERGRQAEMQHACMQ